jgi:2'-5' RNA ligase
VSRTESKPERWRIFCAVELPEDVRSRAAAHIARLRENASDVRAGWDKPEKLHITLKFLGEIETTRLEALERAAGRVAARVSPFSIAVEEAGAFPPRGQPRVLWLGVRDESENLSRLQRSLEDECALEGFPREPRAFHPHLTIARPRASAGARVLAELHRQTGFSSEPFTVAEFLVIRSELGRGGSRYTVLSRHALGQQQTAASFES